MQPLLEKAKKVSQQLKFIAHPHRLAVLCCLAEQPRNVSTLTNMLGISQSAMSNHLAKLRDAGMVDNQREHRELIYFISDPTIAALLQQLHQLYCNEENHD